MDYVWDEWGDLVGYYSRRELTFFLDKLPALSGVASRVHEVTKSRYLAGMWRESLPASLCWIQDDENPEILALPEDYVAPSWSWASVLGGVEAQIERTITSFEPSATILEAECHVPGLNPFGRVSGGHLTLRGQISEAILACDDPHKVSHYEIHGSEGEWYFYPDSALISFNGEVFRAKESQVLSEFSTKVVFLYLGASLPSVYIEGDKPMHYAMALGPSGNNDGSYCRIGLATVQTDFFFEIDDSLCKDVKIV
jgi:hypothetical protein